MEPKRAEGERRSWSGESLWDGLPFASRNVLVTDVGGDRFLANGSASGRPAFAVVIRGEQLFRFRREMERAGAQAQGFPPWTEPGPGGRPPPDRGGGHGSINSSPDDPPPPPPSQPKAFVPDQGSQPLLLMADQRAHRPVLPPEALARDAIARIPTLEDRLPRPEHLGDPGGNPNDLARQRWGIIAPQGLAGDRLLEAVRPLIKLREEQQGSPASVYRVGPGGGTAEANEWVRRTYLSEAVREDERPRYLLILGDLPDVSAELQQRLVANAYVGRLTFDGPDGYAAYANKVVRAEASPPQVRPRALFFATRDGSAATNAAYDSLIAPALALCDAVPRSAYPVREILEVGAPDDWSVERLFEAARRDGPSILFTVSHGLGPPRDGWASYQERRQRQGALVFGSGEPLAADGVAGGRFLPGGAWFFLACLSAGTPSRSVYLPWLERLKASGEYDGAIGSLLNALPAAGEPPFIAALPRAALSNPEGPLALIGHLDLAWTYSFQDAYGARRPARFVEVVKQLWTGRRVGVATRALLRFASETESELLGLSQADAELAPGRAPPPEVVHRGHLWMERQDLVGYLLLGDPAVQVAKSVD